jgi:hypothetical protein
MCLRVITCLLPNIHLHFKTLFLCQPFLKDSFLGLKEDKWIIINLHPGERGDKAVK